MLKALIAGERDPEVLAEMSKGVLRKKIPHRERHLAVTVSPPGNSVTGKSALVTSIV
jgi:hypothetical protein